MNKKPLMLASLNVRSLGRNSFKQKRYQDLDLRSAHPTTDLTSIGASFGEIDCANSTKGIEFWNGASFWNHGILIGRSQRLSTGTSILVDRIITPLIKDNNILMEGRAQFITLQSPDNKTLTIINVYAAMSLNETMSMWKKAKRGQLHR
jgi:hypothetical protein